ncbi:MAG: glucosaminidase domain-containing protein [Acidimicrobiia bacterium]
MRRRQLSTLLLTVFAIVVALLPALGADRNRPEPEERVLTAADAPGVPVMGQSRMTGAELAGYYRSVDHLPNRTSNLNPFTGVVTPVAIEDLANLFVSEGNRYNVRGDIAFAQSIVETAWFNFPDNGQVRPWNNNFAGIGACDSCANGFQFPSLLDGVRGQIQLLRNYADIGSRTTNIPDPPVPSLWGSNPATAAFNFDHFSHKGRAPLWNNMGNGNWATATNYATTVLRVYNQMLTATGHPGECPPDGLVFGAGTGSGSPCPVSLRQPGRAIGTSGGAGYYVLNGDGSVNAYRGAPYFGAPSFPSDLARDIAVMPDGQGYVVLDGFGRVFKFGSAARGDTLGNLGETSTFPVDWARSIAITPDGRGYLVLYGDGAVAKFGSAATGALGGLSTPSWPGFDWGRSIKVTFDGKGYVILDTFGGVWKFGTALQGAIGGTGSYGLPGTARDIDLVFNLFLGTAGYYMVDAFGTIYAGGAVSPLTNPNATPGADRWRGLVESNGDTVALENDGTVTFATR